MTLQIVSCIVVIVIESDYSGRRGLLLETSFCDPAIQLPTSSYMMIECDLLWGGNFPLHYIAKVTTILRPCIYLKYRIQMWDRVLLCNWGCVCKCYCVLYYWEWGGGLNMAGTTVDKKKKIHKMHPHGSIMLPYRLLRKKNPLLVFLRYVFLVDKLLLHLENIKVNACRERRRNYIDIVGDSVFRLIGRYLFIETCCKYLCSSKWDMDSKHSTLCGLVS